jgi:hypothetical protein
MTSTPSDELFRRAAEAEDGMPVSAGARVEHARWALEAGRALHVDLSAVPEDQRPAVVAAIRELVERASTRTPRNGLTPAPGASDVAG